MVVKQNRANHSGNSEGFSVEFSDYDHPHRASFQEWYNEEYAFFLRRKRQHYDLVIMEDGEYKWDTPKNAYRIWCAAMECAKKV
jgi:hypothetical protein